MYEANSILTHLWVGPLVEPSLLSLSLKALILFSNLCWGSFSFHHLQLENTAQVETWLLYWM